MFITSKILVFFRLSHTLMLVPNLHWVIVEDSATKTDLVAKLLATTGMQYTHINAATPKEWKLRAKVQFCGYKIQRKVLNIIDKMQEPRWNKPRGVIQRNAALQWVRDNVPPSTEGVIYFLDDDNSYALQVFEEVFYI
jgi:galactosylgalactosylxylosylprotein 3-beta-glucuronosyltransferase 3